MMAMSRILSIATLALLAALAANPARAALVFPDLSPHTEHPVAFAGLVCLTDLIEARESNIFGVASATEPFLPPISEGETDRSQSEAPVLLAGATGAFGTPAVSGSGGTASHPAALAGPFAWQPAASPATRLPAEAAIHLPNGPPFELLRPS